MDSSPPSQGAFINAARFTYAFFGFSLSVIAAFISLFRRSKAQNELLPLLGQPGTPPPSNARIRRPVRTLSDQSVKFAPLPSLRVEKQPLELSEKESAVSVDNVAPSIIPVIAVGPSSPISTDVLKTGPQFEEPASDLPAPPPYTARSSTSSSTSSSGSEKAGFRLFNIKGWSKDGKDRPKVERRQSSPHILCQGPLAPLLPGLCNRPPRNELDPAPLQKSKSRKALRAATSVQDLVDGKSPRKRSLRKTEKKKSQILRTQPYEAPYFATVPTLPSPQANRQSFYPDCSVTSDSSSGD